VFIDKLRAHAEVVLVRLHGLANQCVHCQVECTC
jgi:hypothetical protein